MGTTTGCSREPAGVTGTALLYVLAAGCLWGGLRAPVRPTSSEQRHAHLRVAPRLPIDIASCRPQQGADLAVCWVHWFSDGG